ncbi:chromate transporter-domain-containing protein [Xylariomycetidae sp. FL2044]|nr:chromate transporter-domain-containing protein [Xylariomycetidae sp. FL2044]
MITPSWNRDYLTVALRQVWDTIKVNWFLGFTAFGGPPVHFKIFHDKFIVDLEWIGIEMYQELFSITQAISGPASTKMLYCINLIHGGTVSAVTSFLVWSLPGALGMYGLSIGVSMIGSTLPAPVYALLSGLNAATVGIVALAASELSEKAITDSVTRVLVFLVASAGLLYNALWYFPLLMLLASSVVVVHDYRWVHRPLRALVGGVGVGVGMAMLRVGRGSGQEGDRVDLRQIPASIHGVTAGFRGADGEPRRLPTNEPVYRLPTTEHLHPPLPPAPQSLSSSSRLPTSPPSANEPRTIPTPYRLDFSWKVGTGIISAFLASFLAVMTIRGVVSHTPILYRLFANMYLAGTIIFGGGPVVIPLLREYVVGEGWVAPRDFLIGLALIQAFPGPNFNFAVFLGSLTAIDSGRASSAGGAVVAFLGIFTPGMVLVHGTMGIWSSLRSRRWVRSGLRGVNAGAVGLIFTAVYRLWQIGYIGEDFQSGTSLGNDPWWVVVTATSYVGGRWFGVSPPSAIVLGAVLGLVRYSVVSASG